MAYLCQVLGVTGLQKHLELLITAMEMKLASSYMNSIENDPRKESLSLNFTPNLSRESTQTTLFLGGKQILRFYEA